MNSFQSTTAQTDRDSTFVSDMHWPGPMVIGAGALGAMVAAELCDAGLRPLLVDETGMGAGQTGHAHGFIHRGSIYGWLSPQERREFDAADKAWRRLTAACGVTPLCSNAAIGFSLPADESRYVSNWKNVELHSSGHSPVEGFQNIRRWYTCGEIAIRPSEVLARLVETRGIATAKATITSVTQSRHGRPVIEAEGFSESKRIRISAESCVLASGRGLLTMLEGSGRLPLLTERRSFMLIVRSKVNLPAAFVLPGDQTKGLFAVRRQDRGNWIYLISDHTPLPATGSIAGAEEQWLKQILFTIRNFVPSLWLDPEARWGCYFAPKMELIRSPGTDAPEASFLDTGHSLICAAIPGKLTLAPLMAQRIRKWAVDISDRGGSSEAPPRPLPSLLLPSLKTAPELWTTVDLRERDDVRAHWVGASQGTEQAS